MVGPVRHPDVSGRAISVLDESSETSTSESPIAGGEIFLMGLKLNADQTRVDRGINIKSGRIKSMGPESRRKREMFIKDNFCNMW